MADTTADTTAAPAAMRLPVVGVMGSGTEAHAARAEALGAALARLGVHLLTGGGAGTMAAVSRGFARVPDRRGLVVGVLPAAGGAPTDAPPGYPNAHVELAIRTHLSARGAQGAERDSRNHVNVLSSDVIVALPGGDGTASEVALALRYGRPIVAHLRSRDDIPRLPAGVPVERELAGVLAFVEAALAQRLQRMPPT